MNTKMINVILRLLKAVNFVIVVIVVVVVVIVVVFNVNLRLLKATIKFVWWVRWMVRTVIFVSNSTIVLRLCCGCVVFLLWL